MSPAERIAEIRALLDAATPGPWRAGQRRHKNDWIVSSAHIGALCELQGPSLTAETCVGADARLIAAAPEALRLLLEVAEAARRFMDPSCATDDDASDTRADDLESALAALGSKP